jgi:cholesterol oxidase
LGTLEWSESMRGRVSFDAVDYNEGWWHGTPCSFAIDVRVDDVERFFADDAHEATCTGFVDCDGLGERMPIEHGTFNLLVAGGGPRRREMRYRLFARDRAGREVTLAGFKNVEDGWFRDTWVDTTTLFTRLYPGWVSRDDQDAATPLATGVLHVSLGGFLRLMAGMRGRLRDRLRYGSFFAR